MNKLDKLISRRRALRKKRYTRQYKKVCEHLQTHPCKDCGESRVIVLEFDHLDPSKKVATITIVVSNYSWKKVQQEIDKCEVVCANCHKRRTAKGLKTGKLKRGQNQKKKPDTPRRVSCRKYRRKRIALFRQRIHNYLLLHPCIDCGERDPIVLEFDHRDPSNKTNEVTSLIRSSSWKKILDEIKKCDVVCTNCHRIRTAHQYKWSKSN